MPDQIGEDRPIDYRRVGRNEDPPNVQENRFRRLVGARIRAHRDRLGLTRQELGAKLGLSFPTVQSWEEGLRELRPHYYWPLANTLGVTCDELLRPEGV